VRVSTENQARAGISLATRQAKSEASALVQDWTLGDVICDEEVGTKTTKHPGLQRLLTQREAQQAEVVMVYKLDRLTRAMAERPDARRAEIEPRP
jgi:DNA invertase Pin-like site-specific DNA recombinase